MAIHYRLSPASESFYLQGCVTAIRADLPAAPIEVLTGKCVVEI